MKNERDKYLIEHGIFKYCLESWDAFHKFFPFMYDRDGYVFRGQPRSYWEDKKKNVNEGKNKKINYDLLPSILRDITQFNMSVEKYYEFLDIHLDQFRNSIKGRTNILGLLNDDDDEAWALGQHYGLKTPLLDFTYSPYVAAFFAFSNSDRSKSDYCSVYAISQHFIESTHEFGIYEPETDHNQRLMSQSGLFVKFNRPLSIEQVIKAKKQKGCKEAILVEILMPVTEKERALKHLESMNIDYKTLFPDLQGSSEHANELLRKKILNMTTTAQKKQDIETLNEVERMQKLKKKKR